MNHNIKVSFVILHYNNLKYTQKCIESLKKYLSDNVNVIVVDNGSTKNSLNDVAKNNKYDHIHYIISKENLGFAKGNNLGYVYAKEKLKSNIIILTNNDTWFEQKNFIFKLLDHYKDGFDVAGPKILTKNGTENQNPILHVLNTKEKVRSEIFKYEILNLLCLFNLDTFLMKKVLPVLRKETNKTNKNNQLFKLHGACLILANNYVKKYDGLYPNTFMYGEEDFLWYRAHKNNLKVRYFNDLIVNHKGNATTDSVFGKGRKRRKFYYKWNLDSYKKLFKLMNEEKND